MNSVNSSKEIADVEEVHVKIRDFLNTFNSSYRLILLNCHPSQRQGLVETLLELKMGLKSALDELGKSLKHNLYTFRCGQCDKQLIINPGEDMWNVLQSHEHFEQMYYDFLNGKSLGLGKNEASHLSEDDSFVSEEEEDEEESEAQLPQPIVTLQKKIIPGDNSFRFNFNLTYDKEVQNKFYPSNLMSTIRRYDKVNPFSMIKANFSRAVCLICNCEVHATRLSKNSLIAHIMGQRHLKAASAPDILASVEAFHDFWLRVEGPLQAHQIYFRPHSDATKMNCVLCELTMSTQFVTKHILADPHRSYVLQMYKDKYEDNSLIPLQVQVYGVQVERAERPRAETNKVKERKTERQRPPRFNRQVIVDHNIIRSVEKSESSSPVDQLPFRMRAFSLLLKTTDRPDELLCSSCNSVLEANLEVLKQHYVASNAHEQKEKYKYFCEICNSTVKTEEEWMAHDFQAPRHVSIAASRKPNITEFECTTCNMVIFGDEISISRHKATNNGAQRKRDRRNQLLVKVKELFQTKDQVLNEARALADDAEEVLANSLTRECCSQLETDLREVFKNCKTYPFGSRVSGIGNKDSDLDVFVDVGTYYGKDLQDPPEQIKLIRAAHREIVRHKNYTKVCPVLTARTPILKLRHLPTRLDCDLSFKHGLSVENTKFIRFCIELQPRCQGLILFVKKWAGKIEFENISTYAIAMLCIFYLQTKGYLLSVKRIRELNGEAARRTISGWDIITYTYPIEHFRQFVEPYTGDVFDLLKDLFHYYWKFDFNSYVVCPLLGELVQRSLFNQNDPDLFPPEMEPYLSQLDGPDPEPFRSLSHMCIQDPFDLSHNLTKAAQQGTLLKFQNMCKFSYECLQTL